MNTNNKNKSIISELLDSIPEVESKKTKTKMRIAARIDDAMKSKGWKKLDLMKAMNKNNPSIITQWLSGTHNFTIDTLVEICHVLEIDLFNLDEKDIEKSGSIGS